MAQNRPDATHFGTRTLNGHNLVNFGPILTFLFKMLFLKTIRMVTITKLYDLYFRFWFLPQFLLLGLTLAVLHVWTQNYLQNVGTCPGRPLQLPTRNNFFQSERAQPTPPPPPLNSGSDCMNLLKHMEHNPSYQRSVKQLIMLIKHLISVLSGRLSKVKKLNFVIW